MELAQNFLLRSQKNEVFAGLQSIGLSPRDFRWEEVRSKRSGSMMVSQLRHAPTGYYFMFDVQYGGYFCEYSPGEDTIEVTAFPEAWNRQHTHVVGWLDSLKREVEAPDLWATIGKEKQLVADATRGEGSNALFTIEEQKKIRDGVEELKRYVLATQSRLTQQSEFVAARLDYLADASQRLGRKDWLTLAVGVIAEIVIGVALTSEAARELLRMAGIFFGWVSPGSPLLL